MKTCFFIITVSGNCVRSNRLVRWTIKNRLIKFSGLGATETLKTVAMRVNKPDVPLPDPELYHLLCMQLMLIQCKILFSIYNKVKPGVRRKKRERETERKGQNNNQKLDYVC